MKTLHPSPLQTRAAGNDNKLSRRDAVLKPPSLDSDAREVRCTLATETPVLIYDWRTGRRVEEVLLASGAEYDDQTPLLRDHSHYSVSAILGSVTDVTAAGGKLDGLLSFGRDLDEASEGIWRRVQQGHLRRVSVGYTYVAKDYTTIPAGRSASINGITYTASAEHDRRIVTRWSLREVSVVVIPADADAQMREDAAAIGTGASGAAPSDATDHSDANATHPRHSERANDVDPILEFLRQHGLADAVTERDAAIEFSRGLLPEHQDAFAALCRKHDVTLGGSHFLYRLATDTTSTRADNDTTGGDRQNLSTGTTTPADAVAAERKRCRGIRELATRHPLIDPTVVQRAQDEGWDLNRTREAFLNSLADAAPEPVGGQAPAGHVRQGGVTVELMQAALLERHGIRPDSDILGNDFMTAVTGRTDLQAEWLDGARGSAQDRDRVEQAFSRARELRLGQASHLRLCTTMLEMRGERVPYNDDDIVERAFSHMDFSAIFGTVIHVKMIQGYALAPATYERFCAVRDVPDFRPSNTARNGVVNGFKKLGPNGGKAALLNATTPALMPLKADRYAGTLKLDEQTLIQDTFSLTDALPEEVGKTARQIPTDMAFAVLLSNENLGDGGGALFVAGTNLITSGTLDLDGLIAANAMLEAVEVNKRRLQINGAVLVAGVAVAPKAAAMLGSELLDDKKNPFRDAFSVVKDNAIDLGVYDPRDDRDDAPKIVGRPDSFYLFGTPGRSIEVGFRQGTNRAPRTRRRMLTDGEWGIAWDVNLDVGAAASDRIGAVRVDVVGD
jgi:hypothetical protein